MNVQILHTGYFKLDGGAMFGVVPRTMWSTHNPPDQNNLCTWALRCLLVQDGDRVIVIDCGMGRKQDDRFRNRYGVSEEVDIAQAVQNAGVSPAAVTDVILTHLHFDHCGGATRRGEDGQTMEVTFPNATYWVGAKQLAWSYPRPNAREKASFLRENIEPLLHSGQLQEVPPGQNAAGLPCLHVDGHTDGMLLPMVPFGGRTLLYCADLLPSTAHLPLPWVMAYDVRPLQTLIEKEEILETALRENWLLFFEHDPVNAVSSLVRDAKGVIQALDPRSDLSI
jgi:glyoxylase-like metal-dependent hydrolase (beta-lactamase superfamily II)